MTKLEGWVLLIAGLVAMCTVRLIESADTAPVAPTQPSTTVEP